MREEASPVQELSRSAVIALLVVISFLMFGDVLFSSGETVLSREGADLSRQFVYWREFGFRQLAQGNLPLWNPHLFSGAPFLGSFQSALLYPPNLLYLILPLGRAINASIALHVFLIGLFTYLWTSYRGLHSLACFLSAILVMFSGAHFLHVYAGHLPNLCTMAWAPLLLLSIDGLIRKPALSWCLLGASALAMQILAGHPQYVYYTLLTLGLYAGVDLLTSHRRLWAAAGIAGMCLGAAGLAAVQIASGIAASGESIRSIGLPVQFAAMFSFPPENFLTFVSPYFFGDMSQFPYWGRGYLWEMCPFFGVTGLALTVYGVFRGDRRLRFACIFCAGVLLVLALGAHTPLFFMLYRWIPGYAFFRGSAKFIFFAALFLAMLAGVGLDHLIRNSRPRQFFAAMMACAGLLLGIAAVFLLHFPFCLAAPWSKLITAIASSGESYLPASIFRDVTFIREAALFAARGFFPAAAVCFLLSLLLLMRGASPRWATYLIAFMAAVEVFTFARTARPTFSLNNSMMPTLAAFYASHPGDYRVLNTVTPNSALSLNAKDIWGYDPGIPLRYARFIAFTQGYDPEEATQYIPFRRYDRLYSMLRCRFVIVPHADKIEVKELPDAMPHLLLLRDWRLIGERTRIFREMSQENFDPQRTVILEEVPDPQPKANHGDQDGYCLITDSSTDHLSIRANLPEAAILLVTDSYSRDWRASPLDGSVQQHYRVLPANYTLMAIPLSAGAHHLRLEYRPTAFIMGKWISLCSLAVFMLLLALCMRKKIRRGTADETGNHQDY